MTSTTALGRVRVLITPDTKSWTWVLDRACGECGFDAHRCAAESVAGLIRLNGAEWARLFAEGLITPGRPDASTWSSLEYACHVRDVYRRYGVRVGAMLADDDPLFANWDQDLTAIEHRYQAQSPIAVLGQLTSAAESLAALLDGVNGDAWERPGRRSDGASFTVSSIVRYMIHDTIHHVWDVTKHH